MNNFAEIVFEHSAHNHLHLPFIIMCSIDGGKSTNSVSLSSIRVFPLQMRLFVILLTFLLKTYIRIRAIIEGIFIMPY